MSSQPQETAKIWATVNQCAETFLTPRRAARVLDLMPPLRNGNVDPLMLLKQESPAILRQQLVSALLSFFNKPEAQALDWVPPLKGHAVLRAEDVFSDRARQCRAALRLFLGLHRIEQRLAEVVPVFPTGTRYWIGLLVGASTCSNWNCPMRITICRSVRKTRTKFKPRGKTICLAVQMS